MIFITGTTGLLGSHLVAELLDNPATEIFALCRPASSLVTLKYVLSNHFDNPDQQLKRIRFIEGDLFDIDILEEAMKNADAVYHCAAKVSFDPSDKSELMKVNVEGTSNIINAALKCNVKRFCHVSSIAALGRADEGIPVDEETPWEDSKNNSIYSVSKHLGEMEVWRGIAEGLPAVIVNPALILSAGNWTSSSASLFRAVAKGLPFYTTGTNGFVDVVDVARSMILLTQKNITAQRYTICGANISYQELFSLMAKHLNVKAPKYHANRFLSEVAWRVCKIDGLLRGKKPLITKETARTANGNYLYSSEKFIKETGFQFTEIEDTVKRICVNYLSDCMKMNQRFT